MQPGTSVFHANFGYGTIISINNSKANVKFDNVGEQFVNLSSLQEQVNS